MGYNRVGLRLVNIDGSAREFNPNDKDIILAATTETGKTRPVITLIITLLVALIIVVLVTQDLEHIRAFIGGSGWIGLAVSVLLYGVLGLSPIPSEPLTVLISSVYGPLQATLVAGLGNTLAALIEYFIGERLRDAASFDRQREKLPFGLGRLPVDSPVFLIAVRSLPGYGPKFISILSGVYRVPLWRYIWTATIPTFLGAAIFAYGGLGIIQLQQK